MYRVNECPCGDTVIHLYQGADSTDKQETRKYLLQYLKGSKAQVQDLKKKHQNLYAYFEKVLQMRRNHIVEELPPQYAFFLLCCFKPGCSHPLCSESMEIPKWFDSGPLISHLPLPIPDPNCCYGSTNCQECKEYCHGHFMKKVWLPHCLQ